MKIRLVSLKRSSEDTEKIRQLYESAFPENERAPFAVLLRGMKKKNVNFFSCHADGEWAGLLYVVNRKELSYIFYFAVDEAKRGRGIGTAVLKAAQKKYSGRTFFLAAEEVDESFFNYSERVRRQHFYEHAGFVRTGQKMQEGNVIFDLMSAGGAVADRDYRRLMRSFMGLRLLFIPMKILDP